MTQFNLGYRIEAKDATQSTLASALSGVTKFAKIASKPITIPLKIGRGGLSLLRDFNLGLRPLVSGLDNIIDRGARLNLVSKSFQSLTGKNAEQAGQLADELVRAASGTVSLIKAQETANRALGSGLNVKQLKTAIEFISKKAITTGKNAAQAVNQVITGLSRGTPLFLDDFGILVDGIPGVAREFDRINGSGAFDSLGPAARKAELIRQAITEMRQQMGKIGVTGKETSFVFQTIKNSLGDSVDKLFAAVAASKSLRDVMTSTRDVVGGITKFLEGGGSLIEVLTGKKGGKSGGLFGLVKAGVLDLAEDIGRAIAAGLLKAAIRVGSLFQDAKLFSGVIDSLSSAKDTIVGKLSALVSGLFGKKDDAVQKSDAAKSAGKSSKPSLLRAFDNKPLLPDKPEVFFGPGLARDVASSVARDLPNSLIKGAAVSVGSRAVAGTAGLAARGLSKIMADNAATEIRIARSAKFAGQFAAAAAPAGAPALQRGALATSEFVAKRAVPIVTVADFAFTMFKFVKELKGLFKALGDVKKAQEDQSFAEERLQETRRERSLRGGVGITGGSVPVSLFGAFGTLALGAGETVKSFKSLDEQIDKLTSGGSRGVLGGRRFRREKANFLSDFPPTIGASKFRPLPIEVDRKNKRLSDRGFSDRVGRINILERRIRRITGQTRRDARRLAGQRIRRLEGEGFDLTKKDKEDIRGRIFKRLLEDRTKRLRERIKALEDEIDADFKRRRQEGQAAGQRKLTQPANALQRQIQPVSSSQKQAKQEPAQQKQQNQFAEDIKNSVERMEGLANNVASALQKAIQQLAGDERKIANAGGRRT